MTDENHQPNNMVPTSDAPHTGGRDESICSRSRTSLPLGVVPLHQVPELSACRDELITFVAMGLEAHRVQGGYYRYTLHGVSNLTKSAAIKAMRTELESLSVPKLVFHDGVIVAARPQANMSAVVVMMSQPDRDIHRRKIELAKSLEMAGKQTGFGRLKLHLQRETHLDQVMHVASEFHMLFYEKQLVRPMALKVFEEAAAAANDKMKVYWQRQVTEAREAKEAEEAKKEERKKVKKEKKAQAKALAKEAAKKASSEVAETKVPEPEVAEPEEDGWKPVRNKKGFRVARPDQSILVPPMVTPQGDLDRNAFKGLPSKPSDCDSLPPTIGSTVVSSTGLQTMDRAARDSIKLMQQRHVFLKNTFVSAGLDVKHTYNLAKFVALAYKQNRPWSRRGLAGYENDLTLDIEDRVELLCDRIYGKK